MKCKCGRTVEPNARACLGYHNNYSSCIEDFKIKTCIIRSCISDRIVRNHFCKKHLIKFEKVYYATKGKVSYPDFFATQ